MIKVYIGDDPAALSLAFYVVRENEGQRKRLCHLSPDGWATWDEVDPAGAIQKPTFSLDEEVAHALRDALDERYQGSADVAAIRSDLDYERKRSEGLMDLVASILHTYNRRVENGR